MGLKITSDCRGIINLTNQGSALYSTGSGILSNDSITIGPLGTSGSVSVTNRSGYTVIIDGSREVLHNSNAYVTATSTHSVKFKDGKDVEVVACFPV